MSEMLKVSYHKSALDGNYTMDIANEHVKVELHYRIFTKNLGLDASAFVDFMTEQYNGFTDTKFPGRIAFKREEDVKGAMEYVESILLMQRLRE